MNIDDTIVVIPAYNEEESIVSILLSIPDDIDFIVIDDCSNDKTPIILQEHSICFLRNEERRGVSYCLKRGVSFAKDKGFSNIITMDADGQHDPALLSRFKEQLVDTSFVIANRFFDASLVPTVKLTSNCFASKLVKQYLGFVVPDVSCGYRGFRINDYMEHLFENQYFEYEMVYDTLLWSLMTRKSYRIINTPPIYFPSEMWCTRRDELLSLVKSIDMFADSDQLKALCKKIEKDSSFKWKTDGTEFYFHYVRETKSFLIQADTTEVIMYYEEIRNV